MGRASFGAAFSLAVVFVALNARPWSCPNASADVAGQDAPSAPGVAGDVDGDWDVDPIDLCRLGSRWLNTDCAEPGRCDGADVNRSGAVDSNDFTILALSWGFGAGGDLSVTQPNNYPTRLAQGPDGKLYVSDAMAGSVFIYNPQLNLMGELKNLSGPLGVAVAGDGRIYVGSNGRDSVEGADEFDERKNRSNNPGLGGSFADRQPGNVAGAAARPEQQHHL